VRRLAMIGASIRWAGRGIRSWSWNNRERKPWTSGIWTGQLDQTLLTDGWVGVERAGRTVEGPPMFIMTIAVGGLPAVPVVVAAAEARERRHAALECGGRLEGRASMNADRGRLMMRRREIGSEPVVTQMSRL
jgi:hypothetical protein